MLSSSNTLILRDHWSPAPGELSLFETGGPLITEQTDRDLSMQSGIVLTTEGLALPWVPALSQIKRHLRLEMDDTEDNELLVVYRDSAAAMLLGVIGQDAGVKDYVGEADYSPVSYRLIKIDRSNVQSVASVSEVDDEGTETIVPDTDYAVRWQNKVAYLDGEFNKDCDKARVKVAYRRGFIPESAESKLLRQVLLDTINSLYVNAGALTERTLQRSPAYNTAMMLLQDRRSMMKWSY